MVDVIDLSYFIIRKCYNKNIPITHLRLQWNLYVLQEINLKITGNCLFKDEIYRNQFGTEIKSVYNEFCIYSSCDLTQFLHDSDKKIELPNFILYGIDKLTTNGRCGLLDKEEVYEEVCKNGFKNCMSLEDYNKKNGGLNMEIKKLSYTKWIRDIALKELSIDSIIALWNEKLKSENKKIGMIFKNDDLLSVCELNVKEFAELIKENNNYNINHKYIRYFLYWGHISIFSMDIESEKDLYYYVDASELAIYLSDVGYKSSEYKEYLNN